MAGVIKFGDEKVRATFRHTRSLIGLGAGLPGSNIIIGHGDLATVDQSRTIKSDAMARFHQRRTNGACAVKKRSLAAWVSCQSIVEVPRKFRVAFRTKTNLKYVWPPSSAEPFVGFSDATRGTRTL